MPRAFYKIALESILRCTLGKLLGSYLLQVQLHAREAISTVGAGDGAALGPAEACQD